MRYTPLSELSEEDPKIVVDGAAFGNCLQFSHWPNSRTPSHLSSETSTEIVLKWLATAEHEEQARQFPVVTTDHYDADGLLALWSVLNPKEALETRDQLAEYAKCADYERASSDEALKIAQAVLGVERHVMQEHGREFSDLDMDQRTGFLYHQALPLIQDWLADPESARPYFEDTYESILHCIEIGKQAGKDEYADVDLAVISPSAHICRFGLFSATECSRVLYFTPGGVCRLLYTYESWVQTPAPPAPRIDLSPLAQTLTNAEESASRRWRYDGNHQTLPMLACYSSSTFQEAPSTIERSRIIESVREYLSASSSSTDLLWNPYAEDSGRPW